MIKINQHAFDCNQMMCRVDKQLQLGNLIKLAFCENWNRVESLVLCARLFCNDGLVPLMCHLLQHKRHHRRERSRRPFHPNPPVRARWWSGTRATTGGCRQSLPLPRVATFAFCCKERLSAFVYNWELLLVKRNRLKPSNWNKKDLISKEIYQRKKRKVRQSKGMPFPERNPPDLPILPGPDFRYF